MTELSRFNAGTKLTDANGVDWRILARSEGYFFLIRLNTGERTVIAVPNSDFFEQTARKSLRISADQEMYVIDEEKLSARQKEILQRKKAFVEDVREAFEKSNYFVFHTKRCTDDKYKLICMKHGYDSTQAARVLRDWFHSGFQDYKFVESRYVTRRNRKPYVFTVKTGRKPAVEQGKILAPEDEANFTAAIMKFLDNPQYKKTDIYYDMVEEKYSFRDADGRWKALPITMIPTFDQYDYFYRKRVSKETKTGRAKRKSAGIRNDRLLSSTACFNIPGPGHTLEVDALEIDIQVVSSEDNRESVGKPILYMLIDCFSRDITAAYVSFNNNSKIALRGLMANLFEDKVEVCRRHGFELTNPELIPSNFIPRQIRADNGADFVSDWFEEACSELGIELVLEPPACGSMKGTIERSFRAFHDTVKPQLSHSGVITNEYGDKSKVEACHDIDSIYNLVYDFICYHNSTPRTEQQLTKEMSLEMLRDHVTPTPIAFWHYGVKKYGEPRHVYPAMLNQTYYKLLEKGRATLSHTTAVKWNGLYYDVDSRKDPVLYARLQNSKNNAGKKDKKTGEIVNSMEIRYDSCSMGSIFYLYNGKVIELLLSPTLNPLSKYNDVVDMTLEEYEAYRKDVSFVVRKGRRARLENTVTHIHNTKIIDEGKKSASPEYVSGKNIKENRKAERNDYNASEKISSKMIHIPETGPIELSDVVSIQHAEEQPAPEPVKTAATDFVSDISDEDREECMAGTDYRSALNALFDRD